ncbi:hypothetical protein JMJ77_0006594 [Colletotrichum scovillei]|uniref:Uncharacterized protein n=1 Tax=Colletotrichum scovillei TaxID=1209932 RepID=A0A9P7RJI1_9PEZI|nr:hypothetical protein JMJ77_0006594 [Colletotrichum scovillei]KAG7077773.1 hypothetical protein JMJ76_0015016 [Colletotrichum scovillei]KAG7084867.1 hypothetical protein JMJ78_0010298 [Colletotrichum scovillei]
MRHPHQSISLTRSPQSTIQHGEDSHRTDSISASCASSRKLDERRIPRQNGGSNFMIHGLPTLHTHQRQIYHVPQHRYAV